MIYKSIEDSHKNGTKIIYKTLYTLISFAADFVFYEH